MNTEELKTCIRCGKQHGYLENKSCGHNTCGKCLSYLLDEYDKRCKYSFICPALNINCPCGSDMSQTVLCYSIMKDRDVSFYAKNK
jgi:hypothetical protein